MNDTQDLAVVDSTDATLAPVDVRHYIIDPVTGERIEVTETEVLGYVQEGEGAVATEVAPV